MTDEKQPEEKNSLDKATEIAERMEAANIEAKEIIEKAEKMKIEDVLSGNSRAGQAPVPLSKQDIVNQGMKEYFKGTLIEKALKAQEVSQ